MSGAFSDLVQAGQEFNSIHAVVMLGVSDRICCDATSLEKRETFVVVKLR